MASDETVVNIKQEDGGGGDIELQSYLDLFNKEVDNMDNDGNGNDEVETITKEVESEEEEQGGYYIDPTGNYFYQVIKGSEQMLSEVSEGMNEDETITGDNDNVEADGDKEKLQGNEDEEEVSYVLIMDDNSKPDDEKTDEGEDGTGDNFEYTQSDVTDEQGEKLKNNQFKKNAEMLRALSKSKLKKDSSLNEHMCGYCDYSSSKRYLLARHLKSHSEERPYKCSICERGFKTQASLQNHVNTHTGVKPHQCTYCTSSFTTSGELVRHVRYRHTHEKPHKCHECDYASVELSKLKRHIRCHTGERPYQCPHCTYASPDTFKLKRHMRIHTGEKPYECDICHARFTQSNSLKAHKLIHSVGDKPVFQCELCPTTCGRKTDLRIHVQKLHTSDHPLKCRRCNKLFPDRYTYKVHSKTHEGEKCFKCELCPYASISARHLESHMLIHTDQKPFECDICEQTFRQKQLLKRHYNLYHNKDYVPPKPKPKTHVCPHCERSFSHKGNLIRHMAIHDPDSGAKEEAYALKLGRQKKVYPFESDAIEIIQGGNDDGGEDQFLMQQDEIGLENGINNGDVKGVLIKEENQNQIVSLQTDNSGQYVVLEVIQVEGTDNGNIINDLGNPDDNQDGNTYLFSDLPEEVPDSIHNGRRFKEEVLENGSVSKEDDMRVCFGFDVN